LQKSIFLVNKEPCCIWDADLVERNTEFLDGLDTRYFDYVIETYLYTNDRARAAVALRINFHHSMETLYSLLGAYIQAYDCVYAWLAKCQNHQLRDLIKRTNECRKRDDPDSVFTKLNIERVDWKNLADAIFYSYMPETIENEKMVKLFSTLWARLADEFTNQDHIDEYNSLKHGFRVHSGGSALYSSIETEAGVPASLETMQLLGQSRFGTSFFKIETVGKREGRSLKVQQTTINWEIEKVISLTRLVSMSINNIIYALKIVNGMETKGCEFLRPLHDEDFEKPWEHISMIPRVSMSFGDKEQIVRLAKKELLEQINVAKQGTKV
jgi:hypothetical protein